MPELRQRKLLYTVFFLKAFYDFIYDWVFCIVECPSLNPNWWSGMTVDRSRSFLILLNSNLSKNFDVTGSRLIGRYDFTLLAGFPGLNIIII
jgi:hypothetical protein